ncbi:uncharacterized protein LOC144213427 isoform X2 [Stigmatopora nigra]
MPARTRPAKFQEEYLTVCKMMHEKVPHRLQGFRNNLGADGQESVDLEGEVELPQNKEEEPEFPQHQMGDEQLPIKKEEDQFTRSLGPVASARWKQQEQAMSRMVWVPNNGPSSSDVPGVGNVF